MRGPTTVEERQVARQICEAILADEENRNFPDMVTVTLHATGVLKLLDEYDQMLKNRKLGFDADLNDLYWEIGRLHSIVRRRVLGDPTKGVGGPQNRLDDKPF